jgi:hypothetical protein
MQLQHKDHGNKLHQLQLQTIDQEEIMDKNNSRYQRYLDKSQQFDKIAYIFFFFKITE